MHVRCGQLNVAQRSDTEHKATTHRRSAAVLEAIDHRAAIGGGAVETLEGDACSLQLRLDQVAEGRALCEAFGLDPLGTIASGALLMTLAPAEAGVVIHALAREAIDCHFIGQVVPPEQGVTLNEGTRQWPLPAFARDEIAKLFEEA